MSKALVLAVALLVSSGCDYSYTPAEKSYADADAHRHARMVEKRTAEIVAERTAESIAEDQSEGMLERFVRSTIRENPGILLPLSGGRPELLQKDAE